MSYQAVIRNSSSTLVTSTLVGMRISILHGSSTGKPVYEETHIRSTNENGLVSLEIGTGTIISGSFPGISWSDGPYFLKTETDLTGGSNYTIEGSVQLLSVPYALLSEKVVTPNYPVSASDTSVIFLAQTSRNLWATDPNISLTVPETGKYLLSFYGNMFNTNETFGNETSYDSDGTVRVFNLTSGVEIFQTAAISSYVDLYSPNDAKRKFIALRPSRTIMVNLTANDVLKLQYFQSRYGNPPFTGSWYMGSGGINILKIGN